jgi:uncharacterized protein YkwD
VRKVTAAALAAACVSSVLAASAGADTNTGQARTIASRPELNRAIFSQVNELRAQKGLRPIRVSRALASAARGHSMSMARQSYFSHESADGTVFWRRVQHYYGSKGFRHWEVGENLLWASPDVTPQQALQLWLDSPPHRRILLSGEWHEVGLAAVHATAAFGPYEGRAVTIVPADFGARSR